MSNRRVVLSDLPLPEKERFYEFLVANKVEFIADQGGEQYVAMIRVVPPEPTTARITGRVRQASKTKRSQSAEPGGSKQASASQAVASDPATTLKAAQSVLRRRYTRFCNLLPVLAAPPKALRRISLIRFADDVYDARYERDSLFIKTEMGADPSQGKLPQTFPDFVYEYASKRYGLKALVSTNCWGMTSSVELLRGQHTGIDLYGKFLEETYDATDLLFFLFTRSAIERVMSTGPEEKEEEKHPMTKKSTKPKSFKTVQPAKMDAKQVVQVIKMAIDSRRQDLRDKVIRRIEAIMGAPSQGSTRRAASTMLEPDRLLTVATEEYHNSRDLREEPEVDESTTVIKKSAKGTVDEGEELTPEIRKEVRQVTGRLVASLSANGEKDVNPQEVYDWALHVTLRRHKVGDYLEKEKEKDPVTMDIGEMKDAAELMSEQPGGPEAAAQAEKVLLLSPEEFEKNLEENVRQLLLNATGELVGSAVESLPSKVWKDDSVRSAISGALISEFAPAADVLMEAIVGKDYRRWLDTLKIEQNGTLKHRQQFEKLHEEFQSVLSSDISAPVVQGICRTVVGVAELQDIVRNRAIELSKLGKQKRLGEESSDDDADLDATQ